MSSELLYFSLICLGWLFLAGWAVALVIAERSLSAKPPTNRRRHRRRSILGDSADDLPFDFVEAKRAKLPTTPVTFVI